MDLKSYYVARAQADRKAAEEAWARGDRKTAAEILAGNPYVGITIKTINGVKTSKQGAEAVDFLRSYKGKIELAKSGGEQIMKKPKTKKEVLAHVDGLAKTFREDHPELTYEQAFDRVMTAELHREYRTAPDDEPVAESNSSDLWDGRTAEKAVHDQIEMKASELRRRMPDLTEAQAFTKVWETNPNVRAKYQRAREADRRGALRAA